MQNLQCAQHSESRVLTAVNESLINDSLVDVSPDTCLALLIRPRERESKEGFRKERFAQLVRVWTVRISVSHTDIVAKSLTSKADYESWKAWDKKEQKETSKCGAFECNNPQTVVLIALSVIRCLCCSYCLRLNSCLFVKSPKVPRSPPESLPVKTCVLSLIDFVPYVCIRPKIVLSEKKICLVSYWTTTLPTILEGDPPIRDVTVPLMNCGWVLVSFKGSLRLSYICTFVFMHLADAFIQSDLQLHSGYTFSLVCVFPGNRTHNLLRCWRNALPLSHTGTCKYEILCRKRSIMYDTKRDKFSCVYSQNMIYMTLNWRFCFTAYGQNEYDKGLAHSVKVAGSIFFFRLERQILQTLSCRAFGSQWSTLWDVFFSSHEH